MVYGLLDEVGPIVQEANVGVRARHVTPRLIACLGCRRRDKRRSGHVSKSQGYSLLVILHLLHLMSCRAPSGSKTADLTRRSQSHDVPADDSRRRMSWH